MSKKSQTAEGVTLVHQPIKASNESQTLDVFRDGSQKVIADLLKQPHQLIAEVITGAIKEGNTGVMLAGGRILQGAMKGKFLTQLANEISDLVESGKIKKNYAEQIYGLQSLTELFQLIDSGELNDQEKFEALKKLFFTMNASDAPDSEAVVIYRLFKIAKNVSSQQLALLNTCYKLAQNNQSRNIMSYRDWRSEVLKLLGHSIEDFVDEDEAKLVELKLLTGREHSDGSGVQQQNWRLTQSGLKLCQLLNS